ncbi:hypothetical protein MMC29_003625 [Sticta canariensis]|nr:hypothetical protein [Sticta canariensis]
MHASCAAHLCAIEVREDMTTGMQNAYENLRRNGAFDEVRLIVKREKGAAKKGKSRGVNIVGITHFPLSQVPVQDPPEEEAAADESEPAAQAADGKPPQSVGQRLGAISRTVKESIGHALSPVVSAMQPHGLTQNAAAPAGANTDVNVEAVDEASLALRPVLHVMHAVRKKLVCGSCSTGGQCALSAPPLGLLLGSILVSEWQHAFADMHVASKCTAGFKSI